MENRNNLLRELPKVDDVIRLLADETDEIPKAVVKHTVQKQIERWRNGVIQGQFNQVSHQQVLEDIRRQLKKDSAYHLKPVINGTGVILHTNLGRAKISPQGAQHIIEVATGYSNLEYNLETGGRDSRYAHVEQLLKLLTRSEASLVVNNNAGAALLLLDTLTKGKEVIVSRGELVEIGASFRIPAIMELSGCTMVEVGTSNKTHVSDYTDHINEHTGALLKVHTSNYRITGFTQEVTLQQLCQIGKSYNVPVIYDLGSGLLMDMGDYGISGDPTVAQSVPYADIVCFSGDKLLGGPQAGIILGCKEIIEKMKKNPLLRALRIDKLTLAALEYTLSQYLQPQKAVKSIPTLNMMTATVQELEDKRSALQNLLCLREGVHWDNVDTNSQMGGGSMPDVSLPSLGFSVSVDGCSPNKLEELFRLNTPPIIARITKNSVVLDMRTIDYSELSIIADFLNSL